MSDIPTILFDSFGGNGFAESWRFSGYVKTIATTVPEEVPDVLNRVEQAAASGLYAAGFIAYEAAAALNPDLPAAQPLDGLPLAWFAVFQDRSSVGECAVVSSSAADVALKPQKNAEEYAKDIELIRSYIEAGDCYQVNHTFIMEGQFRGEPVGLYGQIGAAQQAPFCAFIDTGAFAILSASPELFFSLKDNIITTRPMKGTALRGHGAEDDRAVVVLLRNSAKDKAENLMIVDLLRNDLGIVAETGSVSVDALFEVETYPTVHQMTSTVSARLRPGTSLTEIFTALFPCGSVTGAPKRRSMEIINELEVTPRGVYCGAIGCVAPGGEALFSVAIRTLLLDRVTGKVTMGVGSAVTWDSEASAEYEECLGKAAFLSHEASFFRLIESIRLENKAYTLLDRHIARLAASSNYFAFNCDQGKVRQALSEHAAVCSGLCKVRLLLCADGSVDVSSEPLPEHNEALLVGISAVGVDSKDRMRFHKTTDRKLFDNARASRPDCDEVLLCNEHGQLTEGSYHSLVLKLAGQLVTPPIACGLLPGVLREELLELGTISEQILYPEDLEKAEEVWLINSVRGWSRAMVV